MQLPGAFFAAFVIFLYGIGALDLIRFLIFFALHLPINWIYLIVTPFFLPKIPEKTVVKNPFDDAKSDSNPKTDAKNPFGNAKSDSDPKEG